MSTNKENYLIALDLDGTLLKDDKTLCFLTNLYLRKLIHINKYYVTFASGRSFKDVKDYYDLLKIKIPLILNNGAIIYNPKTLDIDYHGFDVDVLKKFLVDVEPFAEAYFLESFNKIYYTDAKYFDYIFNKSKDVVFIKGDTPALISLINDSPVAFLARFKPIYSGIDFRELIAKYSNYFDFRIWHNEPFFELSPKGISKYYSLMKLAKTLGIDEKHVIFFGDQGNDLECISNLENGYLMKNGNPELRANAHHVTRKDNNHNGIMYELMDFFKKHKKEKDN